MTIEIKVPVLPESVADATIATWHVKAGDKVSRDQNLVDIETDKVVLEVVSPEDGVVTEIMDAEGDTVLGEQVIAKLEEGASASASAPAADSSTTDTKQESTPKGESVEIKVPVLPESVADATIATWQNRYFNFHNVISEVDELEPAKVKRVVMCSGKVYYDLLDQRRKNEQTDVAIVRIEQLYPFPHKELESVVAEYKHVKDWVWCQEEPQNQGAWYCSQHHFWSSIPDGAKLTYAGRPASASPAVGYISVHNQQQKALIDDALSTK